MTHCTRSRHQTRYCRQILLYASLLLAIVLQLNRAQPLGEFDSGLLIQWFLDNGIDTSNVNSQQYELSDEQLDLLAMHLNEANRTQVELWFNDTLSEIYHSACELFDLDVNTALQPCSRLPIQFVSCIGAECTAASDSGVEMTTAWCTVLDGIPCHGAREWLLRNVPCQRTYDGHQFATALLLSIFLGIFGADRFYLGYTCLGVFKMLTLGFVGVWWLIDTILLLAGAYTPADGVSFEPM